MRCTITESFECNRCKDKVCSKTSIASIIFGSGDNKKIKNLANVLGSVGLFVKDYM